MQPGNREHKRAVHKRSSSAENSTHTLATLSYADHEQTQAISAQDKTSKYTAPEVSGVRDSVTSTVMVSACVARR
ncbi:hypothetical protein KI688_006702 [Linnemannia hyalina]|uniref:Uncharacterized protein n=1 Tax=Linnemannia hyalina TaxID=64524 RepID=A0A9P7XK05_9FUNG|nr:hypothetical protein KI688_006702 [Linnemannia hyalina]